METAGEDSQVVGEDSQVVGEGSLAVEGILAGVEALAQKHFPGTPASAVLGVGSQVAVEDIAAEEQGVLFLHRSAMSCHHPKPRHCHSGSAVSSWRVLFFQSQRS